MHKKPARTDRRTPDFYLRLNETERRALDADAARLGIDPTNYLRRLIIAAHQAQFVPPLSVFEKFRLQR